jgi:hypothetical protein
MSMAKSKAKAYENIEISEIMAASAKAETIINQ